MERRKFIQGGAVAGVAVAAASSFPTPAISQGLQEWRMVTSWPKGLPGVGTGAQRVADAITTMSGGRITVRLFAAGELVPAFGGFDAVSQGTADLCHDASYYHLGKSEGFAFFTAFPWGFTAQEMSAWVHHGGGQALWDELAAPFNIKAFIAGNTGTQAFGWFKKELRTVEDLKGLKFRTPGNQAKILAKLGVTVINVPGGEIFAALQSGAIDGAEWIGPANDLSFGFYQVAPFYYVPGYHEPGAALQLMVNKPKYDALPNDLKAVIRAAAQAGHDDCLAEYTALNGPALETLVQRHNVQLRSLPRDILIACGNAANEVLADLREGGDPMTRKIITGYLDFRSKVMQGTRINEQAYLNARQLPFPHNGRRG
ncbi:MAG: TRAP transporter substrate-binding protein [Rhodospirillales bacterium]|jgi:TRAP-type mannitol/chloroaromatic compound transport system substrate-binding protein